MKKILATTVAFALLGAAPVVAQTAPSATAPSDNSNAGMNSGDRIPSGNGASSGEMGSASGQAVQKPTAPQEQQDLKENPSQVPPSQRIDPENPASPSSNGTSQ